MIYRTSNPLRLACHACFVLLILSGRAHAGELFVMKTFRKGTCKITYPAFTLAAGPAWEKINAQIAGTIRDIKGWMQCDAASETFLHSTFHVENVTSRYISVVEERRDFSGGAHDNHGMWSYVYDAVTGKRISMIKEFGGVEVSDTRPSALDIHEAFQNKMATFLAPRLQPHFEKCMGGPPEPGNVPWDHDVAGELSRIDFDFALKGHAVVVFGTPPHVNDICSFKVTVPYKQIAPLINPDSVLHRWLK